MNFEDCFIDDTSEPYFIDIPVIVVLNYYKKHSVTVNEMMKFIDIVFEDFVVSKINWDGKRGYYRIFYSRKQ